MKKNAYTPVFLMPSSGDGINMFNTGISRTLSWNIEWFTDSRRDFERFPYCRDILKKHLQRDLERISIDLSEFATINCGMM